MGGLAIRTARRRPARASAVRRRDPRSASSPPRYRRVRRRHRRSQAPAPAVAIAPKQPRGDGVSADDFGQRWWLRRKATGGRWCRRNGRFVAFAKPPERRSRSDLRQPRGPQCAGSKSRKSRRHGDRRHRQKPPHGPSRHFARARRRLDPSPQYVRRGQPRSQARDIKGSTKVAPARVLPEPLPAGWAWFEPVTAIKKL